MSKQVAKSVSGLLLVAYMGLIFYLSSIPGSEITIQTPDYILHGLAFGGLSFLFTIFFMFEKKISTSVILSMLCTLIYGLADEFHQSFVPGRTPDWRDIASDMMGAIIVQLGLIILFRLFSWMRREK